MAEPKVIPDSIVVEDEDTYWAALEMVVRNGHPTVLDTTRGVLEGLPDTHRVWELWRYGRMLGVAFDERSLAAKLDELGWEVIGDGD